jgi:hypothetical protein
VGLNAFLGIPEIEALGTALLNVSDKAKAAGEALR